MLLRLFVHDLHLEIGHSRATIDILNHLTEAQKSSITKLQVIAFTSSPLETLFPWNKTEREFIQVRFPHLYPFILKSIFYQLWTIGYHLLCREKAALSMSVGIAFPLADVVNIQFIHHHWDELNVIYNRSSWYKKLYKKILFAYFNTCENLVYKTGKRSFIVLSNFTKTYLEKKFRLKPGQASLTYSSVNTTNFYVMDKDKEEIKNDLLEEAPELARLDLNKPIFLFVGGYERKGLPKALELISSQNGVQFIIIGKPEDKGEYLNIPPGIDNYRIPFTKKLNLYYNLCDCFIFPTIYEPFGLVILEAAMTGLDLIIPKNNVGASELLAHDPDVKFLDQGSFVMPKTKVKTKGERLKIVALRKENLQNQTWEKSSKIFYDEVLSKYLPS